MKKIVLASGSPRRREILENTGIKFEVHVSDADEGSVDKESLPVGVYVQELALLKASAVCKNCKDALVIGADTVVFSDGSVMGKPKDKEDAKRMLMSLSGKCHSVFTGICVMDTKNARSVCSFAETKVYFKELTESETDAYISTGEAMDKAGAYGIQGLGALLVDRIDGDYLNVVGLPLSKLSKILEDEFDYSILKGEKS